MATGRWPLLHNEYTKMRNLLRLHELLEKQQFEDAHSLIKSLHHEKDTSNDLITATDTIGCVPLHAAVWHRASTALILDLLALCNEETVQKKNDFQDTPLHLAVRRGAKLEVVQSLVTRAPLVLEERNSGGKTPREEAMSMLQGLTARITGSDSHEVEEQRKVSSFLKAPTIMVLDLLRRKALADCVDLRTKLAEKNEQIENLRCDSVSPHEIDFRSIHLDSPDTEPIVQDKGVENDRTSRSIPCSDIAESEDNEQLCLLDQHKESPLATLDQKETKLTALPVATATLDNENSTKKASTSHTVAKLTHVSPDATIDANADSASVCHVLLQQLSAKDGTLQQLLASHEQSKAQYNVMESKLAEATTECQVLREQLQDQRVQMDRLVDTLCRVCGGMESVRSVIGSDSAGSVVDPSSLATEGSAGEKLPPSMNDANGNVESLLVPTVSRSEISALDGYHSGQNLSNDDETESAAKSNGSDDSEFELLQHCSKEADSIV